MINTAAGVALGLLLIIIGGAMIALAGPVGWFFGTIYIALGARCGRIELDDWRRRRRPRL